METKHYAVGSANKVRYVRIRHTNKHGYKELARKGGLSIALRIASIKEKYLPYFLAYSVG